MKKYLMMFLLAGFLMSNSQLKAQTTDSAQVAKSEKRIGEDLKDSKRLQRKIDKKQRKIERQQRKIRRKENRMNRKMKDVRKEQKKIEQ